MENYGRYKFIRIYETQKNIYENLVLSFRIYFFIIYIQNETKSHFRNRINSNKQRGDFIDRKILPFLNKKNKRKDARSR